MDGTMRAPRKLVPVTEGALFAGADSARHLAAAAARAMQGQGIDCRFLEVSTRSASADIATPVPHLLCLPLSSRCVQAGWRDELAARALALGKPVIVLLDDLRTGWQGGALPTLITADATRIASFAARSQPDSLSLWEFGQAFFVDRRIAAQFVRAADGAWSWRRALPQSPATTELALAAPSPESSTAVSGVRASMENGMPVLWIDTVRNTRHRIEYQPGVRAVIPSPPFADAPVIGFLHMDFDSGRESIRAGEAPVEVRLLGR